jgi:hypothetical protein
MGLQAAPAMTDAARVQYQIAIADDVRTPLPPPTEQPTAGVDASDPCRHTLRFTAVEDPTRRGRPDGAEGVEVFGKPGGDAAPAPGERGLLGFTQKETFTQGYAGGDAGKKA